MADANRLTELGLGVTDTEAGVEAVLTLGTPLLNPLAQHSIPNGVFALTEHLLVPLEPPELVGLPPLSLEGVRSRSELEQQLAGAFQRHLVSLQRYTAALRGLGITARVDPETLELAARVEDPPFLFQLAGDKQGQLRMVEAGRAGEVIVPDVDASFDLSGFPSRDALVAHLRTLLGAPETPAEPAEPDPVRAPTSTPAIRSGAVEYGDLLAHFGPKAWVPPAATIDLVVTLRALGGVYRFAATRVSERTFRALLAGPEGKVWADQFVLDAFPGVEEVAAQALGIEAGAVELIDPEEER
jgi:hypothetical protein